MMSTPFKHTLAADPRTIILDLSICSDILLTLECRLFILMVYRYAMEGNIYASCSKDGAIKLWDGVSNLAVNTIPNAHNGAEVFNLPVIRELIQC